VRKSLNIFLVSDATGHTAESVLTSVLVQFKGARYNIRRFSFTRTPVQIEEIIRQAPRKECIIVYTLVSSSLRSLLDAKAKVKKLTVVDVMGPLIEKLSSILESAPQMKPGMLRHQDEDEYFVTEAIHYTLTHDDGQGAETLDEADLIILGISRTGKTPTSIFLSCRKLKVANIPIVKDLPFPREIIKLPVKKVGLRMNVDRQMRLRSERVGRMSRASVPGYSSRSHVLAEMEFCENVYRRIPALWTVDVSDRSIEETSEWITRNVL
jgi:[pyruvate, water dikinase]-phosphate phosphotransferase / [pyruvate, water dikinase] kinase